MTLVWYGMFYVLREIRFTQVTSYFTHIAFVR